MTGSRHPRRRILGVGRDVLLLALAGVLVAAVAHELRQQVSIIHRRQLDERTFWRWAEPRPDHAAFVGVRVVAVGRATDVVCAGRRSRPGRTCLAIRRERHGGARVVATALVAPGHRAVRRGRLSCPPRRRTCRIGAPGP